MKSSDMSQFSTRQLEKVVDALETKVEEVRNILDTRYVEENKTEYLTKWADTAGLPDNIKEYFLEHCNLGDFILENGYYKYMTNYGAMATFKAWTCSFMLRKHGDYIGFRSNEGNHILIPRHHCKITLKEIMEEYEIVEGSYDKYYLDNLTEYVIYSGIRKDPTLLQITPKNEMFSKNKNKHFCEFDCRKNIK